MTDNDREQLAALAKERDKIAWGEKEAWRVLQKEVAEYRQLMQVIHDLRMIPNWTRILLATDDEPFIVTIDETDVGGERILSTSGDTLLAACQAAYAQYLLWNREYAAKVGKA